MEIDIDNISIGDDITRLVIDPLDRSILALYARASGDHNPIHIDSDYAKKLGMKDVIAHGMLIMSYLGRAITNVFPQSFLKSFKVRFCSITNIGDVLTCIGKVKDIDSNNSRKIIIIDLIVSDSNGDIKASAQVTIEK